MTIVSNWYSKCHNDKGCSCKWNRHEHACCASSWHEIFTQKEKKRPITTDWIAATQWILDYNDWSPRWTQQALCWTCKLCWMFVKWGTMYMYNKPSHMLKELSQGYMGLKSLAKLFNFVVCNLCQSSLSLTILVPLWFIIISLMFFYLSKLLFSGFLQFKGKFVNGQNTSKYLDRVHFKYHNDQKLIFFLPSDFENMFA